MDQKRNRFTLLGTLAACMAASGATHAQEAPAYVFSPQVVEYQTAPDGNPPLRSHYGGVGLIKTRSARMAPDSSLSTMITWNNAQQRYALTFQAAPWLETTFSYSAFDVLTARDAFDRQFDLKVRLWEESLYIPEIAVGLQDFLGTGRFSGEYIVASKRVGPLDLSLGVGWGRFSARSIAPNPLGELSDRLNQRNTDFGAGGTVNFGQFFQGEDIGVFGGVVWDTPIDGLRAVVEYDSDRNVGVEKLDDDPLNFGLIYDLTPGIQLGVTYLARDQVNLSAAFSTVTAEAVQDPPPGSLPPNFYVRDEQSDATGGRDKLVAPVQPLLSTPVSRADLPSTLEEALGAEGLVLRRIQVGETALRVVIDNKRYRTFPKAVGRAIRVLSRYAPADMDTFQVAIDQRGIETAEFFFDRNELENGARESGYSIAPPFIDFTYITPGSRPVDAEEIVLFSYPDINYSIQPDIRYNTFGISWIFWATSMTFWWKPARNCRRSARISVATIRKPISACMS